MRVLVLSSPNDLEAELQRVGADECCTDIFAAKNEVLAISIVDLSIASANILKQTALAAGADCAVHRWVVSGKVRRSDAVLFATRRQLAAVTTRLRAQPECVSRLVPEMGRLLQQYSRSRLPLVLRRRRIDLGSRTHVMGILNVTPDSFSDGGRYLEPCAALDQALRMESEGADFIDIGAESTRPGSRSVPARDQLARLLPVLRLVRKKARTPVSVDTTNAKVAETALAEGAGMVNDTSALRGDRGMAAVVAKSGVPVVLMHMRGKPRTMQDNPRYDDLMGSIFGFLSEALGRGERAGIERSQMIIDPGIGFGKTGAHNYELLRRLRELRSLGQPVMIGPSRKRFIGVALGTGPDQRVEGTIAACVLAARNGANVVRVHDVLPVCRALKVAAAVEGRP